MTAVGLGQTPRSMLRLGLSFAGLVFVLDQLTKWLLLSVVGMPTRPPIEVTPFFNLVMVWNRGVSFGLLADQSPWLPYALSALAVAIAIGLAIWLAKQDRALPALAIGMVIGGALGNVVDRLRFGAVADFFDVHVAGWHWPAFNIADAGITVGVALLLLDSLFGPKNITTDKGR